MKTLKTYLNKKDILSLQDLSSEEILLILKVDSKTKKSSTAMESQVVC